jgi:WD40 repeat protein
MYVTHLTIGDNSKHIFSSGPGYSYSKGMQPSTGVDMFVMGDITGTPKRLMRTSRLSGLVNGASDHWLYVSRIRTARYGVLQECVALDLKRKKQYLLSGVSSFGRQLSKSTKSGSFVVLHSESVRTGSYVCRWETTDGVGPCEIWRKKLKTSMRSEVVFLGVNDEDEIIYTIVRLPYGVYELCLRRATSLEPISIHNFHCDDLRKIEMSSDCGKLAIVSRATLKLFDIANSLCLLSTAACPKKAYITDVAFAPDNRSLAVSASDGSITFYDSCNLRVLRRFDWKIGKPLSLAFSPDGLLAAAGGDQGKIVVWDLDL